MNLKYLIPLLLSTCYVVLAELGFYYLIFAVLLAGNAFNIIFGEFSCTELKTELRNFYASKSGLFIKRLSALFLIAFLFWGIRFVLIKSQGIVNIVGFSVVFGFFTGCFHITLAHDLLHSNKKTDVFLASLLLLFANIPHLAIDHVYGHHRTVGLKNDTSTAKMDQSFYRYFLEITISRLKGVFSEGYNLPDYVKKRIFKLGRRMLFLEMLVWVVLIFVLPRGEKAFLFFVIQGFMAYLLYELINYIQHYGLRRKTADSPILQEHSWNCYYKYTNYLLYMLPLHSLHHLAKAEQKKALKDLKGGPKMPYLYFVMISMAMIPPLWFRIMNKLIPEYNE